MIVPMLDPKLNHAELRTELLAAINTVLDSGMYIMGQEVGILEKKLQFLFDVKYALGVSSGTDALILALMGNDIGYGDEVICPSFTFFATAGAVARVGAKPVFADIEYGTFNIDPEHVKTLITPKTKAIIPVHLFGQCANMNAIQEIAEHHELVVIEDACQAIGARFFDPDYHHSPLYAGSIGDVGCFSFFPSKNVGGFGEGGLVTTNDYGLYTKMKQLRVHGQNGQYYHDFIGGNFRMDEIQAACLSVILQQYNKYKEDRRYHAKIYQDKLSDIHDIVLPLDHTGFHVWNQYTIRVLNKRNELRQHLIDNGIATGIYYPTPLHQQPCFAKYIPEGLSLPVTEEACKECLSLPIAPELSELQINYTALQVQMFMKGV